MTDFQKWKATKMEISIKKRDKRFGRPKEGAEEEKDAVILTLKKVMDWQQICLLNYMISHDEFFAVLKALHKVDIANIKRFENPETPFLLKTLEEIANTLAKSPLPLEFTPELKNRCCQLLIKTNLAKNPRKLETFV